MHRGVEAEPGTLDPQLASDNAALTVVGDLFEGLVTESSDGTVEPGAAESWSVEQDGLEYFFKLRRGLRLECAFFAPVAVAGRARDYGLHTDSSHRFERGVDPALQTKAMERATQLLLEMCGGQAGPVIVKSSAGDLPQPAPILLRHARITRLLGITFEDAEVRQILGRLGMTVEQSGNDWKVTPPAFRFDIAIEADLIEELIRVRGYNTIPRTLPRYQPEMKALSESAFAKTQLRLGGEHEADVVHQRRD